MDSLHTLIANFFFFFFCPFYFRATDEAGHRFNRCRGGGSRETFIRAHERASERASERARESVRGMEGGGGRKEELEKRVREKEREGVE